jgi:hypothetical protein
MVLRFWGGVNEGLVNLAPSFRGATDGSEPGIHNHDWGLWIPGLRQEAHPGMTTVGYCDYREDGYVAIGSSSRFIACGWPRSSMET